MEIDATEVVDYEEWRAGLAGASELVGRAFLKKAVQELEELLM
jgi:hypothetical protein